MLIVAATEPPDLSDLMPECPLDIDIAGNPARPASRFALGMSESSVWMRLQVNGEAWFNQELPEGSWHFGLWYFDCAELFLSNRKTGRYLEVNLAPNGAYWIGVFRRPRGLDSDVKPERWRVETASARSTEHWQAAIVLPRRQVEAALGGYADHGNVTLITGGCPDEGVPIPHLRSIARIDIAKPDFHVPDRFVPLQLRS